MASKRLNGFTFMELMIFAGIIGILIAILIPTFRAIQQREKEDLVESNAHSVQLAVEDYAVRNNGIYPPAFTVEGYVQLEPLPFISLLPKGQKFENPFTGWLTEPRPTWSNWPTDPEPGAIYYYSTGLPEDGYIILGYGKYPQNGPIIKLGN